MQKVKINPKSCTKHKGNRILSEFTKLLQKNFYIIRDVNYLDTLIQLEMLMETMNG